MNIYKFYSFIVALSFILPVQVPFNQIKPTVRVKRLGLREGTTKSILTAMLWDAPDRTTFLTLTCHWGSIVAIS